VEDFALTSDTAYVAQNGGRIVRALLEIAISRKWAKVTAVLMGLSKSIEMRLWPIEQPLRQFDLKPDILYGLDRWADQYSVSELVSKSAAELGQLVHLNEQHGQAILKAAKQFPMVHMEYSLRPLCFDVLKIAVQVSRSFTWSPKVHGVAESFWLWVEDQEESTILQIGQLVFRQNTDTLHVNFIISIPGGQPPPFVIIRSAFDRWVGAEDEVTVSLQDLAMPPASTSHTSILDLPFLPLSCLRNKPVQALFADRISAFNAIQTHILWSLFHSRMHSLVCAPAGCGKSLMAQILML
jgi:antiviral helicase SLH1